MVQVACDRWERLDRDVVACAACSRLVAHRETVARAKRRAYRDETYWGRPVPSFGTTDASLWIVGLAPGAHGANRTGRMFTGDSSGDFLWAALHAHGFASQPTSRSRDDGLVLRDARITNVVKCAPPGNRPTPDEITACRSHLERERALLPRLSVVLALGALAHAEVVRLLQATEPGLRDDRATPTGSPVVPGRRGAGGGAPGGRGSWPGSPATPGRPRFGHGAEWTVGGCTVIASYHPSQQNTRTGRLTAEMFARVLGRVRELIEGEVQ